MNCTGTTMKALAERITEDIYQLGLEHMEKDIHAIDVFLQAFPTQECMHYTVHCDQSYGGTDEACALVSSILPSEQYHLIYDEQKSNDVFDAFAEAMISAS